MKISVIMIDGGFRENVFSAKYFSQQEFKSGEFEVIWVEHFDRPHPDIASHPKLRCICMNRTEKYHPSICFNKGISEAKGKILVIPDADLIVRPDFLKRVYELHKANENLVIYGYRYDEKKKGALTSFRYDELSRHCIIKNPLNYGGCVTIRKQWMLDVNGYEQHPVFQTGFHANGLELYTRLKNRGLAIQWEPSLKLYHPWHLNTGFYSPEYEQQLRFIGRVRKTLEWRTVSGIDPSRNLDATEIDRFLENAKTNKEFKLQFFSERLRRLMGVVGKRVRRYKNIG